MKVTRTYEKTLKAYNDGYRFIVNAGGSRSGKTYAELQILKQIAEKKKPRVITTVSHSMPHLVTGAIRDYDKILLSCGISPDTLRTKKPYIYTHGNSIHEFIGFDNIGKALGAARDILFINEANKMSFEICHQLMQRTGETIFIDYNPANKFWVDEILVRGDATLLNSTYLDNIENLTEGQIQEFEHAQKKAEEENAKGIYGYWSNWWSVYGLGKYGQIEGAIYTDWEVGEFDDLLPYRFGLDFGFNSDPDALVKIAVDEKRKILYLHECFYKKGQTFEVLRQAIANHAKRNDRILADNAEGRLIADLKKHFNIAPTIKWRIVERIKKMQSYHIVITPSSTNLQAELTEYVWSDKKSETPIDKCNHLLDAAGYALTGHSNSAGIRKVSF